MKCTFQNKRITSIISVVPKEEYSFDDEYPNYKLTYEKAKKLKKMMGLDKHRIAPPDVCTSDLCLFGLQRLLDQDVIKREEIDALIFVSQTADYILPPTSNVIQGKLRLGRDVFCIDVNQGCAGFVVGLMQAFMLLELDAIRKVVLMVGDTGSKHVSKHNRISYPLVGDAGSVAIVEQTPSDTTIFMDVKMDGSRYEALIIPAGGYRTMPSPETLELREVEEGVQRSLQHIHMDGAAVFTFTLEDVPPHIEEILAFSGNTRDTIDYFLFHQPNQFILKQMADKLKIPHSKLPNNIVGIFGNCSASCIPLDIAYNCGEISRQPLRVCMSGFGVGLTWMSIVMVLGPLDVCSIIDYESS